MIETLADSLGTREHYHVKRDGVAMLLLLLRETTFDALADHPDFRYMVKHTLDSNLRIVVARNPSEVLDDSDSVLIFFTDSPIDDENHWTRLLFL